MTMSHRYTGRVLARLALIAALLALSVAFGLGFASRAGAYVYWTNAGGDEVGNFPRGTIGRAPNYSGVCCAVSTFLTEKFPITFSSPYGLVSDPTTAPLYWAGGNLNAIGRANATQNFDSSTCCNWFFVPMGPGRYAPHGVAIDPQHKFIYWANLLSGTIGRANKDGSDVRPNFITGASGPCGVAVNGTSIYWSNQGTNSIARANIAGGAPDLHLVDNASSGGFAQSCGVAIDASHLYWTDPFTGSIGRVILQGPAPNGIFLDRNFIRGAGDTCCGALTGVASDGAHIYWSNFVLSGDNSCSDGRTGAIGRANVDGTSPSRCFIPYAGTYVSGVAIDGLGPAPFSGRIFPSAWTLTAAGPIGKGAIVLPKLKKPRLIGLVVIRLSDHKRLGLVPLGRRAGSQQRIRWNLKVNGRTLGKGVYEVDLKIFTAGGKPTSVPGPNPFRLVINRGRVRISST
jgi:hypothetical protein